MVIISTSAVLVSIQAVSPLSIFGGAGRPPQRARRRSAELLRPAMPPDQHGSARRPMSSRVRFIVLLFPNRVVHSAASRVSPVRMRTARSISMTKILPSPILPVCAAFVIASTPLGQLVANDDFDFHFGRKFT